jgi:hypothetical protein
MMTQARTPILLFLAIVAAGSLIACGGSASRSRRSQEEPVASDPILIFDWTGGFAGFQRQLQLFPDRRAQADDRRFGHQGEIRLSESRFDSLLAHVRQSFTKSEGPFRSNVADDFHFAVRWNREATEESIHVEGDGIAFPDRYTTVLRELQELTGEVLTSQDIKTD